MLKYVTNSEMQLVTNIAEQYPNCKVLVSELDMRMNPVIFGKVYAVSTDISSLPMINAVSAKLREQGIKNVIVGSYNKGGLIGVQYIKEE